MMSYKLKFWMENILLLIMFFSVIAESRKDTKRLVLHSDTDLAAEVQMIKADLKVKDQIIKDLQMEVQTKLSSKDIASTYVRWGKQSCEANGTQLVYQGYIGGSIYTDVGGSANFQCLPEHPTWANYTDGIQNRGGHMYGTEFDNHQRATFNPFNMPPNQYDDATCAVCRAPYATTIMIPAMTSCYPGWHQQYTGYLMSGYYNQVSATEFICVDRSPDLELHGENKSFGRFVYFVETVCGSLPCQNYPSGREMACVVCSK